MSETPSGSTLVNGANRKAKEYADAEAERIGTNPALCDQVVELFTIQRLTTHEILDRLRDVLGLSETAKVATNLGIIQRVIHAKVDVALRAEIYGGHRSAISTRVQPAIAKGRRKYQEEQQGRVVFSDEETLELVALAEMSVMQITPGRCDPQKLADAMNLRFDTKRFTYENCKQKLANYRHAQKKKLGLPMRTKKKKGACAEKVAEAAVA